MSISFTSFGAAEEVTGSNHVLNVDGKKIVIDFGLFQGRRLEADTKNRLTPYDVKEINAMVLTHAHADHCGRLPLLKKGGFDGNIYCTHATRDIAGIVLADSANIQQKDYEWLIKKGDKQVRPPLYDADDVTSVLNNFVSISYHRPFFMGNDVTCTLFDAGHIVGSSMAVFDLGEDRKIAFTGDLGRVGLPIVRDPDILPDVDYIVCESTYGNRLHSPVEDNQAKLAEIITETVERGGKVIIPAFAIERTQDVLYYLSLLKRENKIPDIPIYVDSPMGFNVTSVYRVHQECYDSDLIENFVNNHQSPFGFEGLQFITDVSQSIELNEKKEPCVIISSSGMCEAGRILHHLKNNVENPKNTILLVGFMAENTLGRRIQEKSKEIKIFGKPYALKSHVEVLDGFSAHADYEEIKNWLRKHNLQRLKKVFLVHGENEAQEFMKNQLLELGVKEVEIVKNGIENPLF